jgi:hypothetical protein
MGIISGLLGHASEVDIERLEQEFSELLAPGEAVERAYKLIRDLIVFTDKRLVLVDKQGMTGKKREYLCIPYESITRFSIESTGHFDLEAELKLWVRSESTPIALDFKKTRNVFEVQRVLASYVLR